jgi:L-iditol 2-dehydrogenase
MKAAVLTEPFHVELVERELPPPDAGELRIRIEQCGLCTSEVDLWTGKDPSKLPAAIGHEIAGVVEELGPEVTRFAVGDRVAAWIHGGGFAEQAIVAERFTVPVATGVAYPGVAEPLACIINAVELAAPALADDVVIVGAGYMGNLLQLVTALKGARSIVVADIRPDALARAAGLAERPGQPPTRVVDTSAESLADAVLDVTDGRGADVAYEVTGLAAGLDLAAAATRMSGKLCIVGYHQGGTRPIPLGTWNWMAYRLVNAHFRDVDTIMAGMRAGMRLVNAGLLDPAPLVTGTYPLEALAAAFEIAVARPDGFVKAVIEPGR